MARRRTSADGFKQQGGSLVALDASSARALVGRAAHTGRRAGGSTGSDRHRRQQVASRPYALSTMSDIHLVGVADRQDVQLPPAAAQGLATSPGSAEDDREAFCARRGDHSVPKSTVLFAYFAQWFTDGFLRSGRPEPVQGRGHARHQPQRVASTRSIWASSTASAVHDHGARTKVGGLLKHEMIDGEDVPAQAVRQAGAPQEGVRRGAAGRWARGDAARRRRQS